MRIDLNKMKDIVEIPLSQEPNYSFDIFMNDAMFKVEIKTFVNGNTRISISRDNIFIVEYAPINIYQQNLNYYSSFGEGAFFFLRNENLKDEPTFLSFGSNDLRLFYGSF